ncbi:MAG: hypothetical protein ACRDOY_04195, partial [Nocardioidaceae bacterium]
GAFKTGTTYLQQVLRANHDRLAAEGVLFPGGERWQQQVFGVRDLLGSNHRDAEEPRISGAWGHLVETVRQWTGPTALVSMEFLSLAGARQARRAVRSFAPAEVRVILTARDLARVTPAMWQESLKGGSTVPWAEYVAAVRDPDACTRAPARGFWNCQDLLAILDVWETAVPREHIQVVTVPPAGASSTVLLERMCTAVGIDSGKLTLDAPWANESVGSAEAEVLRRLNTRLDNRLSRRQYQRVVKRTVSRTLAESSPSGRMALPAADRAWAAERGRALADRLAERGYQVVGDLEDLVPGPVAPAAEGRTPDDANDPEMLDAAMRALTSVTEELATQWWARKRPDKALRNRNLRSRIGSSMRGAQFRSKRSVVRFADRNRVAGRALDVYHRVGRRRRRPRR